VKIVYIRADSRSKYEKVEDVVDNLRSGGVDDVGLLTEQVLDNKLPPKPKT
jgi:biopolymer transport protein ExbD